MFEVRKFWHPYEKCNYYKVFHNGESYSCMIFISKRAADRAIETHLKQPEFKPLLNNNFKSLMYGN